MATEDDATILSLFRAILRSHVAFAGSMRRNLCGTLDAIQA